MVTVEVSVGHVKQRTADNRGRVTLGSDYADKTVTVAIVEVEGDE
jgi:hypothetical protein